MAENPRSTFSPASSSPGRLPPIARPDWPWAARSYSQRSQQSSPHPSLPGSGLQNSWDQRSSISSTSNQSGYSGSAIPISRQTSTSTPKPPLNSNMGYSAVESTRQWTFTGFEWAVRDVHKLRDFVEGVNSAEEGSQLLISDHGDFEILKQSPVLGDSKFKLEIAPTVPADGSSAQNLTTLSLFITSLMVDFAQDDYEAYASMMAAIKCQDDRAGERGARPEWVWEFWQNDWVFRRGSEVWECPLPSLSSLLENPRIRETDSLVICIQIHCPVGPSIPQQPSVYYVPKDLLDGLEASLDNQNTGDVRFICLERYNNHDEPSTVEPGISDAPSPFGSYATARKRVIYAHSDILVRRSEYFSTMLSSAFSENSTATVGERKLYTVVVEEADFETIYWLLKYCYANWLLFRQHDDPRAAVEGVGAGWSVKWLTGQRGEWDWKTFHKSGPDDACDTRSATSGESLAHSHTTSAKSDIYRQTTVTTTNRPTPPVNTGKSTMSSASTGRQATTTATSPARRTTMTASSAPTNVPAVTMGPSSSIPRVKPGVTVPPSSAFPSSSHYPVSPRSSRPTGTPSTPDPHPHPTPAPGPASALAIYQVAHRYAMPPLAALALEHIMTSISPRTSFALLLATSLWDELHGLIEDFVVERWDEVSSSAEFEQCCKEVAAGEWGPDGGKTLMSVFRRLRSPGALPA
ncbi:hypothetical protein CPB83DRAFT_842918 [Crepidotus variabilis]|uniref:BTB domain-containing protein n=1 Tax=Crepidotus variabilis TaxID=179855 RepID=A0A9P6ET52_9AGAR|nr:hypothetical protein CPB83DRAFT_842918 [Crepidotus variabilis]